MRFHRQMAMLVVAAVVLMAGLAPWAQTATCGSVLIYYGNGGAPPDYFSQLSIPEQGNFYALVSYYEGLGLTVDYTETWPGDVPWRDLVILVAPGMRDDFGGSDFRPDQVEELLSLLGNGGRVVVLGDWGDQFGYRTATRLLEALKVGIRFTGDSVFGDTFYDLTPDQVTAGLPYVDGSAMGELELSGTAKALAVTLLWEVPWAVDQSAGTTCARPGCDVVVLADVSVLDDAQYENEDFIEDGFKMLNEHWEPLAWNLVDRGGLLGDPGAGLLKRCEGQARNHGQYVSCVAVGSMELHMRGCLDWTERKALVREAARSDIGKKHRVR